MKMCGKCRIKKSWKLFGKRAASADGLAALCKTCLGAYDRQRNNDPKRIEARKAYAKTPKGIERTRASQESYIKRNPNKRKAHNVISNGLREGKIVKPERCENCEGKLRLHGHHNDYLKPLKVKWLCSICHEDWHCKHGEAKNG